jgi:DNA-binding beta-propeller fold protein YncE
MEIDPSNFQNKTMLTPIINIDTKVPAPNQPFSAVNSDPGKLWADENRTIVINACSEWTTESVPLNNFSGTHRLGLVHDANGAPLIITISNSNVRDTIFVND